MSQWRDVEAILEGAVADGVFPGCVLEVGDGGRTVLRRAAGRLARVPEPGASVAEDTIYDVASLTKAVVTAPLVMRLVEAGRLHLDTAARVWIPELRGEGSERIRVRDLLSHSAGLPAWQPLYEAVEGMVPGVPARELILRRAAGAPLEAAPGTRSVYSDLGFIILGFIVERAAGERLDALAARALFAPLGLAAARFLDLTTARRPVTRSGPWPAGVAPTEIDPRRGLIAGEVHDENCWAAGGILGHAGLFATAADVGAVAAALCASWNGRRLPGGFPPELARAFLSHCGVPGSTWRLGWDGPAAAGTQAGESWPKEGSGHLGFTGCSVWIDPPRERWVVLLTNRVHPSREDQRIKQARPAVQDAVVRALSDRSSDQ